MSASGECMKVARSLEESAKHESDASAARAMRREAKNQRAIARELRRMGQ